MKIQLTEQEMSNAILNALCNGALTELLMSGIDIDYDKAKYDFFKEAGDCYEDVLIKMINCGENVQLIDLEDFDQPIGQISLEKAMAFINSTEDEHAIEVTQQLVNGEDDSETGYCFLQFITLGEIVYG